MKPSCAMRSGGTLRVREEIFGTLCGKLKAPRATDRGA